MNWHLILVTRKHKLKAKDHLTPIMMTTVRGEEEGEKGREGGEGTEKKREKKRNNRTGVPRWLSWLSV